MDDDTTNQPQDNQADDQGIMGKITDAIPGELDDKVVGAVSGAAGAVAGAADDVLDKVTDAIPGELDDKLVDRAKDMVGGAGQVAGGAVGAVGDVAGTAAGAAGAVAGAAGGVAGSVVDKVTDVIPGELDDKLVDGVKDVADKLNPFSSDDDKTA